MHTNNKYDSIMNLPHHVSKTRPQMPMSDRAAQFAPFAALTGYDSAIKETGRLTDERIELDEEALSALDMKYQLLMDTFDEAPEVTITYFQPDERKAGGKYLTATDADIFKIEPKVPYTEVDLNWMDKKARSTIEMNDPASRPEIAVKRDNMKDYDTIFVGFPIWWYVAPTIINTFLESYDLTGKTIIPFATSGGSDIGKTNERLAPSCKGAKLMDGKVFKGNVGHQELAAWVEGLGL